MSWLYTLLFTGLMFSAHPLDAAKTLHRDALAQPSISATLQQETEHFEQTYPLSANGRVSLSNINGSIKIEGWDQNEVKVTYTKTAETKERLANVDVRIDAKQDSLNIEADYGNWQTKGTGQWRSGESPRVDFQLMVPRGAVLSEIETVNGSVTATGFTNVIKVSAVNGTVNATNIRGTAKLSTVNGEVIADLDRLENGSTISLETVNGKVNLAIPSDANATLKADSLNGEIKNDFGLPVRKGKYVGRDLYGRLGTGEVQIRLNSVNGPLSINHRNDGRTIAPATNLLPQKDDDLDIDVDPSFSSKNIDKQVDKAIKANSKMITKEQAKAMADARIDLDSLNEQIAAATAESMKNAARSVKVIGDAVSPEKIKEQVRAATKDFEAFGRVADASFMSSLPRVEEKSGSFVVKGSPRVTINAPGCSVSVRGWDKDEVQYRVVRLSSFPNNSSLSVTDGHGDSSVEIKVQDQQGPAPRGWGEPNNIRVEVSVPRKSDLNISADGVIRIEGVSGDLQLDGKEGSIDVRDSGGQLRVAGGEGRIRVIGFEGSVDAHTASGPMNLEGNFTALAATADDGGDVILTLPDKASVDVDAQSDDVRYDDLKSTKIGGEGKRGLYRIGSGGSVFRVRTDGGIVLRSLSSVKSSM